MNRKKAVRHPQNCFATTDQRVRLQKTAVGTPHDLNCIIYSGRLSTTFLNDGNPTTATETSIYKRGVFIQKENCISMSELFNTSLTQGVNMRKRHGFALPCGETGHIENVVCNDTAAVQLDSLCSPYETQRFF